MKRIICLILVAVMMLTVFCGCGKSGSKKDIGNLILEFEYACNTLDIDALLDCITPQISSGVKTVFGLLGTFSDMDNEEIFDYITNALTSEDGLDGTEFFSSIKIEVKDVTFEDETAFVDCYVSYEINKEEMKREACFTCVYYTEEWYISSFSFI